MIVSFLTGIGVAMALLALGFSPVGITVVIIAAYVACLNTTSRIAEIKGDWGVGLSMAIDPIGYLLFIAVFYAAGLAAGYFIWTHDLLRALTG